MPPDSDSSPVTSAATPASDSSLIRQTHPLLHPRPPLLRNRSPICHHRCIAMMTRNIPPQEPHPPDHSESEDSPADELPNKLGISSLSESPLQLLQLLLALPSSLIAAHELATAEQLRLDPTQLQCDTWRGQQRMT